MIASDLSIPAFLDRRGQKPKKFREAAWRRLPKPQRPEGERWRSATRWEVFVMPSIPALACGLRRLWVAEGRKWCRLHDGILQVKIPMAAWRQIQRTAKEVTP